MLAIGTFLRSINPKFILILAVILMVGAIGIKAFSFLDGVIEDNKTLVRQELQIKLKDAEIVTLTRAAKQAAEAQKISDAARAEAERVATELRSIRDAASFSGDENNGPIAPVLSDTLRALRERVR